MRIDYVTPDKINSIFLCYGHTDAKDLHEKRVLGLAITVYVFLGL